MLPPEELQLLESLKQTVEKYGDKTSMMEDISSFKVEGHKNIQSILKILSPYSTFYALLSMTAQGAKNQKNQLSCLDMLNGLFRIKN